jgi:hypothetical protein
MLCLSTAGAETSAPAETGLVQMQLEAAETGLVPAETQLKAAETGLVPAQAQFQMLCLSTHRHLRRQA